MSTRGSYGFKLDGKYYLAYNHHDSYPEGLGQQILDFISYLKLKTNKIIKNNLQRLEEQEILNIINAKLKECINNFIIFENDGSEISEKFYRERKSYDTLYEYLVALYDKECPENRWLLENDFIKDSLFCEYAYIINVDNGTLDLYNGGQKEPQEGNPFGIECNKDKYYPCAVVGSIKFKDIDKIKDLRDYFPDRN